MYIIIDGRVDTYLDIKSKTPSEQEIDDLCYDLSLCRKSLKKKMFEFKEKTGLNNAKELKKTIRDSISLMMTDMMTKRRSS